MKTQIFGTLSSNSHTIPLQLGFGRLNEHSSDLFERISIVPPCTRWAVLCRSLISDFKEKRENGTGLDNPNDLSLEYDGNVAWVKGEVKGDKVYGVGRSDGGYDYEVRYDAGSKDLAYFEAKDRNYLTRILKEGNLRKEEPAIWYLYETNNPQKLNIANWWSQKLKIPSIDLDKLLEEASDFPKAYEAILKNDVATLKETLQKASTILNDRYTGKTLLDYAYEAGQCDAITLLTEAKAEETVINKDFLLPRAIEVNNLRWLKLLFDAKANVNFQDTSGNSLLHKAVLLNKDEIVKWLITESKINLNIQDNDGLTVLHKAVQQQNWPLADQLLSIDTVNINLKSKDGKTPLAYVEAMDLFKAASNGDLVWLKRLLKLGADINSQNAKGNSILQQAILSDKGEVAKCHRYLSPVPVTGA